MLLTVLCDNNTFIDRYYLGEPAFCCLIEDGDRTILYDTGYSDVFLRNAELLGIDLSRVTDIALSHGHDDHTRGLPLFFERFHQPVNLFAHPRLFDPKRSAEGLSIGSPMRINELPQNVTCRFSEKPQRISAHIVALGQIPRRYPFEQGWKIGMTLHDGHWETDALLDDSALALSAGEGLFIVSGCAHSGVCNIVSYANDVFAQGGDGAYAFLGGTHLFTPDDACMQALTTLKTLGVHTLYPCHCTGLFVKAEMIRQFNVIESGVSLRLEIPDGRAFDEPEGV